MKRIVVSVTAVIAVILVVVAMVIAVIIGKNAKYEKAKDYLLTLSQNDK